MKVLAVNGSPRARASNTQRLLGPLLEGAREQGADVGGAVMRSFVTTDDRGNFVPARELERLCP
jgi:hypothetical protein